MGGANSVDRPGTHLNPQANVHRDPMVRSSKSSFSGEVVAEEANTRMREVSSAPSIFWHESEQGDQLHQRAVRYIFIPPKCTLLIVYVLNDNCLNPESYNLNYFMSHQLNNVN